MSVDGACPLCGVGVLTALLGTAGWLRCPSCNSEFNNHGIAHDVMGREVRLP